MRYNELHAGQYITLPSGRILTHVVGRGSRAPDRAAAAATVVDFIVGVASIVDDDVIGVRARFGAYTRLWWEQLNKRSGPRS
jgi:hypothetical protein